MDMDGGLNWEVDAQGDDGKTVTAYSSNPEIDVSEPYKRDVAS
jgi:hypothetical protein